MVWFDCECGESLKKPSVAKHFQSRKCSFVTCVDCSSTFHGNDFESHIKCISEAQKYMGKLYAAGNSKREGAKQDSWLGSVTALLGSYKGPLQHMVDRLMQYDNIPRKQKAFENFVANSLNLKRDPSTVRQLWSIVEPCQTKGTSEKTKDIPPWKGFNSETTDILERNGGSMVWKLLQANLAKRRKSTHPEEEYEEIRLKVLANIPSEFLRSDTSLVSLA